MTKNRLEAFSDGVIAIIITIMVLEMKVPHGTSFADLLQLAPVFLSYVLSFLYVAIYWNNHHHMLHAVHHINGKVLWANTHLLFWLSLIPFTSGWLGENKLTAVPVALYGVVLFMAAVAYSILVRTLVVLHEKDSPIARALGRDCKGTLSIIFYAIAIPLAFFEPLISVGLYVAVAIMWIIPDRRIERVIAG